MRKLGVLFAAALMLLGVATPAEAAPEYSLNWSGYAVPADPGEAISAVRGAWIVPAIKTAPPGFSSSWIGVGGYATGDLIQVGTASSGRIEGNYAWYEMLPDNAIPIRSGCTGDTACSVAQGDRIVAAVTNVGGDTWTMQLSNLGKGPAAKWHWAKTVTYKSTRSSAEWIFEAPQVGLAAAPFLGGVQTTPAHAPSVKFLGGDFVVNGVAKPLAHGAGARRIIMTHPCLFTDLDCQRPKAHFATPSLLGAGGRFQVCAYKRTCPPH